MDLEPDEPLASLFQSSAERSPFDPRDRHWEAEAMRILSGNDVIAIQRVIRFGVLRNLDIPKRILQNRHERTINDFIFTMFAFRDAQIVATYSQNTKVDEILQRSKIHLTVQPWLWLPSRQEYNLDPQTIAAAIDIESHRQFYSIPFECWVRYSLGFPTLSVEWFLQQHTNLYKLLLSHLRGFPEEVEKYVQVEKALRSRSPFAQRALAHCLVSVLPRGSHEFPSSSRQAFGFITGSIQRLFDEQAVSGGILKILCALAVRFRRVYGDASNMDWYSPFDADVSFVVNILHSNSVAEFTHTSNTIDKETFAGLSLESITSEDVTGRHLVRWESLSFSVWECCTAFPDRISFIQECLRSLFECRNYHSFMAVVEGLQKYSTTSSSAQSNPRGVTTVTPNSVLPLNLFFLINPSNNYFAYRQRFNALPGLPFLYTHVKEAKQKGPAVLHEVLEAIEAFFL